MTNRYHYVNEQPALADWWHAGFQEGGAFHLIELGDQGLLYHTCGREVVDDVVCHADGEAEYVLICFDCRLIWRTGMRGGSYLRSISVLHSAARRWYNKH